MFQSILQPFSRLIALLPASHRRGLLPVALAALVAALFETAGVASILPFMAVVMNPGLVGPDSVAGEVLATLGVGSVQARIAVIGIATIVMLALANAASAANMWVQSRYLASTRRALSSELFDGYLRLPYAFHTRRDAASLTKVVFGDVDAALGGFLGSLLSAVSKGLVALVLVGLIVMRDPLVAVGTVVLLGGGYLAVYRIVRARQGRFGQLSNEAAVLRSRIALEALAAVKELRVLGREATAMEQFACQTEVLARTGVKAALLGAMPRYLLEVLAFGGVVALTLVLTLRGDSVSAIPTLALYALAGYRLMPAFQQIFSAAMSIRYNSAAVATLEADLLSVRGDERERVAEGAPAQVIRFERSVVLDDVRFTYAGASTPALDGITLELVRNQSVGLVGRTGSGKSTLVDVLLGLYPPGRGRLLVDGVRLDAAQARAWRRRVGYVPQHVFLANASIAENIALGVSADAIDRSAVERAARMAQAHDFVERLPQGYDAIVGERGVRLSGGQRQRLGIARALYHDPEILVFDEATSALDGLTEDAVMNAIHHLSSGRTVILIAHRLRTVQACDRIVMLEAGRIVDDGPYDALMASDGPFARLAGRTLEAARA